MAPSERCTPLTIVGGFLGSGKTTLIKRMLTQTELRIAVLVNDFGALNIDAALIAASGATTVELTNGCVCCSIGDDLHSALIALEARLEEFDHVVIEASGVSDPWKIAQIGLLNAGYRLDCVVVLVDTKHAPVLLKDPRLQDTVYRQCQRADILLLNKIDLTADCDLSALSTQLTRDNKKAKVLSCSYAEVPLDVLIASPPISDHSISLRPSSSEPISAQPTTGSLNAHQSRSRGAERWGSNTLSNTHTKFYSCSLSTEQAWTQEAFQSLSQEIGPQILRGKALLRCDTQAASTSRWLEWHRVCGRDSWAAHSTPAPVLRSQLVLIDTEPLDVRALEARGWQYATSL